MSGLEATKRVPGLAGVGVARWKVPREADHEFNAWRQDFLRRRQDISPYTHTLSIHGNPSKIPTVIRNLSNRKYGEPCLHLLPSSTSPSNRLI